MVFCKLSSNGCWLLFQSTLRNLGIVYAHLGNHQFYYSTHFFFSFSFIQRHQKEAGSIITFPCSKIFYKVTNARLSQERKESGTLNAFIFHTSLNRSHYGLSMLPEQPSATMGFIQLGDPVPDTTKSLREIHPYNSVSPEPFLLLPKAQGPCVTLWHKQLLPALATAL